MVLINQLAGFTMTYGYETKHGHIKTNKDYTFGGYSGHYTVNEMYIVKIPKSYKLEAAGPIFCAGITMYSPLLRYKVNSNLLDFSKLIECLILSLIDCRLIYSNNQN